MWKSQSRHGEDHAAFFLVVLMPVTHEPPPPSQSEGSGNLNSSLPGQAEWEYWSPATLLNEYEYWGLR
jgi:hypothetical protein